jgi:hypothetical protein
MRSFRRRKLLPAGQAKNLPAPCAIFPGHPDYNPNFRQLVHVGYKVAAEMGEKYTNLLKKYSDVVGSCVEENIYERHLKRLFDL